MPGLRREELAQLAGVSHDYYARLEQGRQSTASASVLDAVARALRLAAEERSHLYALAGVVDEGFIGAPPGVSDDDLQRLLAILGPTPAVVCSPYADIFAANAAACFLCADFPSMPAHERNTLRWMLLSPEARELYGTGWEANATDMIGRLRLAAGRHPHPRRLDEIVHALKKESPLFRRVWDQHGISTCVQGIRTLYHRSLGTMIFRSDSVIFDSSPGQVVHIMVPIEANLFESAFRAYEERNQAA